MLRLENWKWMEQHLFKSSYTPEHFDISWHLSLSGRSGLLYKTFFYHKYIQLQCLESSISFLVVTAKRPSTETYSDNLNQFKNTETSLIHKINFMWNSFTSRTTPQIILCKFCTFSRIVVYYKFCKFSPSMQMARKCEYLSFVICKSNSNDCVLLPQTSHIVTLVGLSTWFLEWLENVLDKHAVCMTEKKRKIFPLLILSIHYLTYVNSEKLITFPRLSQQKDYCSENLLHHQCLYLSLNARILLYLLPETFFESKVNVNVL